MTFHAMAENPRQRLPRAAYTCESWFERERRDLLGKSWTFAGTLGDFGKAGDFRTVAAGPHSLIVIRDGDGQLHGFHNMCRHRGTELLEGCGNAGKTMVCPYHNWVYNLDGALRGVPAQSDCFPDLDKRAIRLLPAAIGVFRELVFVHPDAAPDEPFEAWIGDLESNAWPHSLDALEEAPDPLVYEIECNWKVYVENALDGYHLAYLHKNTLGGPLPHLNTWEASGRHLVWWSTERDGAKHRIGTHIEQAMKGAWAKTVPGADKPGYGGVYAFFPTTLVLPTPWGISISALEPVSAGRTLLRLRSWAPGSFWGPEYRAKDIPGYDPDSGRVRSANWTVHPLESDDFQTEDVWICEKLQRAMRSDRFEIGPLARGTGGEAAIDFFQRNVLDFVGQPTDA